MKNILVTGGSGLVGMAIKKCIKTKNDNGLLVDDKGNKWIFIDSKKCDLRDPKKTYTFIKSIRPNVIIHLAACVGGLYKNINYKKEMFEDNILINFNVLKTAYELNIDKVISCLSTCVFPDDVVYPINETHLHSGEPHSSNYPYAYSKRFLEIQSRIYNELGGHYICVIPTNIYGTHDNYSIENGHVIPSLIHKFYKAKESNSSVTLYGNGKALRQFLYADDFARILLWTTFEYNGTESFIVSPDENTEISILDVAKIIARYIGYKNKISLNKHYPNGQYKKTASNKKLKEYLPNFNFTSINSGLKETIQWFIKNYPNIRK